jgi:hypothetical protein
VGLVGKVMSPRKCFFFFFFFFLVAQERQTPLCIKLENIFVAFGSDPCGASSQSVVTGSTSWWFPRRG